MKTREEVEKSIRPGFWHEDSPVGDAIFCGIFGTLPVYSR
jgi:hypothetical protein